MFFAAAANTYLNSGSVAIDYFSPHIFLSFGTFLLDATHGILLCWIVDIFVFL